MATFYMIPGASAANPATVNGRTYQFVDTPIAVPDFDGQVLGANGWQTVDPPASTYAVGGPVAYGSDADFTVPSGAAQTVIWNSAITALRNAVLQSAATNGDQVRVVRTASATGAFNIVVGPKNLTAAGQWVQVEYDGTQWVETAYGTL